MEQDKAARLSSRMVARAIDELRRGWPVVIGAPGARHGLLAMASEAAHPDRLAELRDAAGPPCLVLTARRAAVLHLRRHDGDAAAIAIGPDMTADDLAGLADATQDLDRSLRGPLRSVPAPDGATAALRLAKFAGLLPSVIAAPVTAPEGETLAALAGPEGWLLVTPSAIVSYEVDQAAALTLAAEARLPVRAAEDARIFVFRPGDGGPDHVALMAGDPKPHAPVLVRLHSECLTGDILGSLRCDCGDQLHGAIARMAEEGGILLYLRQEGRGIGLLNKMRAYRIQDDGFDTFEANQRLGFEPDERLFLPAAAILKTLGFTRIRLLTNNPAKVAGLESLGIAVAERVPHAFPAHTHNESYLAAKARKSGHYLDLPDPTTAPTTAPKDEG